MRLLANNAYCYNNLELHCQTWDMLQYPSGGYCTFRRFTELQVPYSVGPENNCSLASTLHPGYNINIISWGIHVHVHGTAVVKHWVSSLKMYI